MRFLPLRFVLFEYALFAFEYFATCLGYHVRVPFSSYYASRPLRFHSVSTVSTLFLSVSVLFEYTWDSLRVRFDSFVRPFRYSFTIPGRASFYRFVAPASFHVLLHFAIVFV